MTAIEFTLEAVYPPSVNHYYGSTKNGRRYLPAKVHEFRALVFAAYRTAYPSATPLVGTVHLHLTLRPPDKRKRDIDNPLKALLDALTMARVWDDDSQIKGLSIEMLAPIKGKPACVWVAVKGETWTTK